MNEIAEKRGISDYFIVIYGSPERKTSIVKSIINENKLINSETVFFGDAISDYRAAQDNNIDFILRITDENKSLFQNHIDIIRFNTFHELTVILEDIN